MTRNALTCLALTLVIAAVPFAGRSDTLRVASYNVEMQRKGPGLLLRDIRAGKDPAIAAAIRVIAHAAPDVLALQRIDWDHENRTLAALAEALKEGGVDYPYRLALRPNSGMATELDMNGDGRRGDAADAQGYGAFTGRGGIAVLSRFPIDSANVQDFSAFLWRDLPGALLPEYASGDPFPSAEALAIQRLSSTGHWVVPIILPDGGRFDLLTFQAGPPVFDGPEDRNGRRNHDEIRFWQAVLDGDVGKAPEARFVLAGGANLDPHRSEGRREAISALLTDPRLQDPLGTDGSAPWTVEWPGRGRFRVDYLLPSADWTITGQGTCCARSQDQVAEDAAIASRHRLIWVDLQVD